MDKKLIGWTVVVELCDKYPLRTHYKADQSELMKEEISLRIQQGMTFKVEPEFEATRKVIW